jgi:hypothetical protein
MWRASGWGGGGRVVVHPILFVCVCGDGGAVRVGAGVWYGKY